jgi:DNA-directed RNA polymerase sigma subunit (sigma70/sigma32)
MVYNEGVLAHRAERQQRGVCILCGKKVCKKSVRYCKGHFERSSKLAQRRDRKVAVRGALLVLFEKKSMLRSKLEKAKEKLALKVDKLKFRIDLTEDELWVLENRVLCPKRVPLREAGGELGISHEWVRQTELHLAQNLKKYLAKEK